MQIPGTVEESGQSFFRDFVDNSDTRLGNYLLTEEGRVNFNGIKSGLEKFIVPLPRDRDAKFLAMAMIQHAISQILSDIALEEDGVTDR